MKHDIDQLLKNALSSKEEPDYWLNQRIIQKIQEKESETMSEKNRRFRIPAAAMIAAAVIVAGSASAYAAWRYLTPEQVAQTAEDQKLAAAFQGEEAVAVNEVQEYGNYRITLLGIVSGKNLSQYEGWDENGNVLDDRTYVVTAIENVDGTPRPDTSEEGYGEDPFFVSPLIEGLNPAIYNSMTMDGGYSEMVEDGIQYRIAECNNVEMFADRQVYLCVNDGNFYNNEAYLYDESSGGISRNEAYQGVNALFTLPLDKGKANKEAAEKYVKDFEEEWNQGADSVEAGTEETGGEGSGSREDLAPVSEGEKPADEDFLSEVSKEVENWKQEDFDKYAKLIKEMEIAPNKDGDFEYDYEIESEGIGSKGTLGAETLSERDDENMAKFRTIMDGDSPQTAYIETYTLKEDGNMVLRVYFYSK